MGTKKTRKLMYCVTVKRNASAIDKYYRSDKRAAESLASMNADLFPNGRVDIDQVWLDI